MPLRRAVPIEAADHSHVWDWASNRLERTIGRPTIYTCVPEPSAARCEPVLVGGNLVGALVYLDEPEPARTTGRRPRVRGSRPARHGDGRVCFVRPSSASRNSSRADSRIVKSPRVSSYRRTRSISTLRQIFRKLSITSRIELTRLVIEHGSPDPIGGRSDARSLRIQSGVQ